MSKYKYNFLDLTPSGLRQVYRIIVRFDLAANLLAKSLETSTIVQVRENMFIEGFRRVRSLVVNSSPCRPSTDLAAEHGKEFLGLNSASTFYVVQYKYAELVATEWLVDFFDVPLWVVQKDVYEQAQRYASERTDEEILDFFASKDQVSPPKVLEAIAA